MFWRDFYFFHQLFKHMKQMPRKRRVRVFYVFQIKKRSSLPALLLKLINTYAASTKQQQTNNTSQFPIVSKQLQQSSPTTNLILRI